MDEKKVMKKEEKWADLGFRLKVLYISGVAAFILGWGITIYAATQPPEGVIDNSILIVLGQGLTFCSYALGLDGVTDYLVNKHYLNIKKREGEENQQQ